MSSAIDRMNGAVMRVFGQPVIVDPDGFARVMTAIPMDDWVDTRLIGESGTRPQRVVHIRNADMEGIATGTIIQIDETNLTVTGIQPDDGGMTRCTLEAYR